MNSISVYVIFIEDLGSGHSKLSHKSLPFETWRLLQFNLQTEFL